MQTQKVKAKEGDKLFQSLGCSTINIYGETVGRCYGLQRVQANRDRDAATTHKWKDRFKGGHYLQHMVVVDKVRALVCCRKCAGWATSNM